MISPGRSGRKRRLRAYVVVALGVSIAAIAIISLLTMDRNTFKAISHIEIFSFVMVLVFVLGRRLPFKNTAGAVLGGKATAVSATAGAVSMLLMTVSMPIVLILGASKIHVSLGMRTVLVAGAIVCFFAFMFAVYSMRDPSRVSRMLDRITPGFLRRKPWFQRFEERLARGIRLPAVLLEGPPRGERCPQAGW